VLIVSHNGFNATPGWPSVIVVPLSTSDKQARRGPTAVPISKGVGSLQHDSVALCHQVTTLDRNKLVRRIGRLPVHELSAIGAGLRAALDLDAEPSA
jgi:mRNA-degrading endonuclease toxin of MazEF toxin-antitoxin module